MPDEGWSAVFLYAVSPGQIIRYLERQQKAGKIPAATLFVSDAVAPTGLRVLVGDVSARAWIESSGAAISNVFTSSPVTLVWERGSDEDGARSGYAIWSAGTEIERGEIEAEATVRRGMIARLLQRAGTDNPVLTWATQRQLPASRIPALRKRGPALAIVDYEMVSRLDQKSLLVENSPRLYRFGV